MFKWLVRLYDWLLDKYDYNSRKLDMLILWPTCKEQSPTLNHAKAIFYMHAVNDPAWTNHYSEQELIDFVDNLSGDDYATQ